jgi:DNA-binding LytR/AlgR family response regulator
MSRPTILCVDDELIVLHSLKQQLTIEYGTDFNIEIAQSGPEALSLFEETQKYGSDIPLVIADYIMPEMKGDELLYKIKQTSPHTQSILLTGQAALNGIKNALNNGGISGYITKPWDKVNLYSRIDKVLDIYYKQEVNEELRQTNKFLEETFQRKADELLKKKQEYQRLSYISSLTDEISNEICNSLSSIKTGIDMVQTHRNSISEENPHSVTMYMSNVESFYKAASYVISDLVVSFERNLKLYLSEPFESGSLLEVLNNASTMRKQVSDSLSGMQSKVVEFDKANKKTERIVAWDDDEILLFNLKDVLFFTSEGGNIVVFTVNGKFKVKEGLDALENRLCLHRFFRCHRSYLVNLDHISKISSWIGTNSHVIIIDDHKIPISRNRIKEVKDIFGIP